MRNIKISTRLIIGFALMIILLSVIAGVGVWRMNDNYAANINLQERQHVTDTVMHLARQVEVNANQTQAFSRVEHPQGKEFFTGLMQESQAIINDLYPRLEQILNEPEAVSIFNNVKEIRRGYLDKRNEAVRLATGRDSDFDKSADFFNREMPILLNNYISELDKLVQLQINLVDELFDENEQEIKLGRLIIIFLSISAIIIGLLAAYIITRSITRPLMHAVDLADYVAQRDLTHDIVPTGKDEITRLENALHDMVVVLQESITEVNTGSESIATASKQINAGNLELSSRTEEQSSALTETAASMEEITATVRQNADNAMLANNLSENASKIAIDGNSTVSNLVETMTDINEKSRQISAIINTIDGIAFQTNILALNAAVEAARAGEQGRGFAVVAGEVRSLAQRSASAANEIKDLINSTVDVIGHSNEQAVQAGDGMEKIVDAIRRVTDIMGEISSASKEQTIGIEQINEAITQMDDVTRQNASLVEQSASAAANMEEQSLNLAELVRTFKLNHSNQSQFLRKPTKNITPKSNNDLLLSKSSGQKATALLAPGRNKASEIEEWDEF